MHPNAATKLDHARRLLDQGEPSLSQLAGEVGMSPSHLQRSFRARYGLSPAAYLAQRKLAALKDGLRAGSEVSAALYDAGYGSPSRVYELGAARLGMTPATYRSGGAGMHIRWALVDTALGTALVATTERGICMVELGTAAQALEQRLRAEFPRAHVERVDAGRDEFLAPRLQAVAERLAGGEGDIALDLVGTAFQRRVWDALMRIPAGHTLGYAELAGHLGLPRGARAVASACARNRVAVMVPCHRVVRGDGSLGGYRWGLPLKQQLLLRERKVSSQVG